MEAIIDTICYEYNYYKPRMYRQNAHNDYLALAKCRKRSAKKIRKAIKKQLQYVKRDLGCQGTFVRKICLKTQFSATAFKYWLLSRHYFRGIDETMEFLPEG